MIKAMESMGTWMLGRIVPTVRASAACPPEPYCRVCGLCYLQRCWTTPQCGHKCSGCGYNCSARSGAPAVTLC